MNHTQTLDFIRTGYVADSSHHCYHHISSKKYLHSATGLCTGLPGNMRCHSSICLAQTEAQSMFKYTGCPSQTRQKVLTLLYMGYFDHFVTSCITQTQKIFWCTFWVWATKDTHVTKLRGVLDPLGGSWWSCEASKWVGGLESNPPPPCNVGLKVAKSWA